MTDVKMHKPEMTPLGRLKGAEYNPREMPEPEMAKLMRSLEEFGFVEPVVARVEDGLIIGGHQRTTAMRRLLRDRGLPETVIEATEVPVVFVAGVSDEKAKLLNVALNKIHGEWDYQKLSDLFATIPAIDVDVTLSGFTPSEIEDITGLMSIPETTAGDDEPTTSVDDELAARARKFAFDVETDAEAKECNDALRAFGMTGPRNAAAAFVALARAAMVAKTTAPTEPAPPPSPPPARAGEPGTKRSRARKAATA